MSGPGPLATRSLDHCLGCGGARLVPLPLRYEFRGAFPLVECRDCGLRFLAVQPRGESLAELYAPEYFERDFRCGRSASAYYSEAAFRAENDSLLDAFDRLARDGARRLLEVGCAGGWLLKRARERGWEVQGVELSPDAVAHARSLGAYALREPESVRGINQALAHALTSWPDAPLEALLVVLADVPAVTSSDIESVIQALPQDGGVVICPSRAKGTSALALRPPSVIPFRFGEQSFQWHKREAAARRLETRVLRIDSLLNDIDEPEDLRELMLHPAETATHRLLSELALEERLAARPA